MLFGNLTVCRMDNSANWSTEQLKRWNTHKQQEDIHHYGDVVMDTLRLKSPPSTLFTQPFIRVQIKENIKAPRRWPLCGEFTGDRWIPRTMGQWCGKCFHFMTSSCIPPCSPTLGVPFNPPGTAMFSLHEARLHDLFEKVTQKQKYSLLAKHHSLELEGQCSDRDHLTLNKTCVI